MAQYFLDLDPNRSKNLPCNSDNSILPHTGVSGELWVVELEVASVELRGLVGGPKHLDLADVGVPPVLVVGDDRHLHKESLQIRLLVPAHIGTQSQEFAGQCAPQIAGCNIFITTTVLHMAADLWA